MGSVVTNVIGDVAAVNGWAEGSTEKTILHGVAGLIQAKIGGTSVLSGFAAGVVNEQLVKPIADYIAENCSYCTNPDGSLNANGRTLLVAGTQIVGAATGALVGGNGVNAAAGGSIAGTATVNNYLSHHSQIKNPKVVAKILDAGNSCAGPASCTAMIAGLDGQIGLLTDDNIATMCAGDASCVANRTEERNTYVDARNLATAKLDPNTAAATYVNSQSNAPYSKSEISASVTRIQNGTADPNDPVDTYVRNSLNADPALLGAVLGVSIIDTDGGKGSGGGKTGKTTGTVADNRTSIQFGGNDNQASHTFRHTDAAGFNRGVVTTAIQTDLAPIASGLPPGPYSGTVVVNGVKIDYVAFKFPDGTINIGRITPPR